MLDELTVSSNLLCAAIQRYSAACLAIQRSYARGEKPHTTTPQLALRMDAEVEIATSLELKLRKATAAISWSRNYSSTRIAINSLPSELLAYIFRLVYRSQPCPKRNYDTGDAKAEPIYPAVLALVCSRWREVVSSIPGLWSHIDISTSTLLNRECLNGLMQLHVDRAGQLPLDLHIFDSHSHEITSVPGSIHKRVDQLASRISSLDLDVKHDFNYGVQNTILSILFRHNSLGELARLTLTQCGDSHDFIKGYDNPEDSDEDFDGLFVNVTTERFEDIMSHVSILRLDQIYPLWNSRAYHGLVELRLTGSQTHINEVELVGIIRSSPDLRIFQFNLTINNLLPTRCQITPIPLNNMEVLNLAGMKGSRVGALLKWLSPGAKPLQFAVTHPRGVSELDLDEREIVLFCSRSCVTNVFGQYLEFSHIQRLLDLLPNLQILALDVPILGKPERWEFIRLAPARQLQYLYMANCAIHVEAIIALINHPTLSIKTFLFYRCSFCLDGSWVSTSYTIKLAQDYPSVTFVVQDDRGPNPVENWEFFPSYEMFRGIN